MVSQGEATVGYLSEIQCVTIVNFCGPGHARHCAAAVNE